MLVLASVPTCAVVVTYACHSQSTLLRQEFIQQINVTANEFERLVAHLDEGRKFYDDILRDYIAPLQKTVTDFVNLRTQVVAAEAPCWFGRRPSAR